MNTSKSESILVIGAGIAGITAALEAAEAGSEVVLVEREPFVGGRVVRNHQYFPKMCPPSCGMEINLRRIERNPRLRVMTHSRIADAAFNGGSWRTTVKTEVDRNCLLQALAEIRAMGTPIGGDGGRSGGCVPETLAQSKIYEKGDKKL